ncbi:hypothetical protein [Kingella kingae]|uniref:hypothetical protein n=1 Tax=Kingella kingae TaxID=504 RepID=UPI0003FB1635|nr:hypothetical protein [Kingella kingae]
MISSWLVWLLFSWLSLWQVNQPAQAEVLPPTQKVQAALVSKNTPYSILRDSQRLQHAQTSLAALPEFNNQPIEVFQKIDFFDGTRPRIELAIRSHQSPNQLVFYTFEHDKWTASPVEHGNLNPQDNAKMLRLSDVSFVQAALVAQIWQDKAREIKAVEQKPYYVSLVWLPKQNKRFWHTATLETVGAQYYLSCHENGEVWEWKRLAGNATDDS